MVAFYTQNRVKSFDRKAFELECTSLDLKGRGVGRYADVVWFVKGLLPGEKLGYNLCLKKVPLVKEPSSSF